MRYEGKAFAGGEEHIDGNEYIGCTFDDVSLVYSGGELPAFEDVKFLQFRFLFRGPALRTLSFIKAMGDQGNTFEQLFAQIFPDYERKRSE
jgi:hypothetical protein